MSEPFACVITPLDAAKCEQYVAWLLGEDAVTAADFSWALAHCDDGVTWGRLDGNQWQLGSTVFPEISPPIRRESLQQLRLFAQKHELLIWKSNGAFVGRLLTDADVDNGDPRRPGVERRIVRGDRVVTFCKQQRFTHVADRAGTEQVLPIEVHDKDLQNRKVRLQVKHYFTQEEATGALRVALTRLVGIDV